MDPVSYTVVEPESLELVSLVDSDVSSLVEPDSELPSCESELDSEELLSSLEVSSSGLVSVSGVVSGPVETTMVTE